MAEREQHDIGLFLARLLLGSMFIVMAYHKFADISGVAGFLASKEIPAPTAMAWLSAIIEMVGGIALVIGVFPGRAALVLALYLVPATITGHGNFEVAYQLTHLLKNVGLIGGLLAIWSSRGGRIRLM